MTHKHTYDEHGLCFECDKPQPKAAMMKRLRAERKDQGLVEFRCWCTPEQRSALQACLDMDTANVAYEPVIEALGAGRGGDDYLTEKS